VSVIVLQGGGRVLGVRSDALAVLLEDDVVALRDPEQVEEVHVYGDGQVTPAARHLCLLRGVDLVFLTEHGRWLGRLTSRESPAGERRLAQLEAVRALSVRLAVARALVAGKISNQETHLRRVQRRVRHPEVADAAVAMRAARGRCAEVDSLDVLRGLEGLAARLYFGALQHACSNPLFSFTGRSRRPPRDPINAALSFAYTLLVARVEGAVRTAGLDPFVGFLHEAIRGNPAVALDLAEEWRPMVDAMVFGLFNRRELSPEDFQVPGATFGAAQNTLEEERPAVHLGPLGREIVFRTWFRRLEEPLYLEGAGARLPMRQAIVWQAAHLARVCEQRDAIYAPVRWT
jgi:CRISPR-associated protein Cas1